MISPITLEMGASNGAATPSGRSAETVCSFSETICRARKMSVPQSNSTHTTEIPCAVDDRTRLTPVAPLTAVSMGNVTSVSTSSGASPCASVSTVTVGAVKSGKTSTGIFRVTSSPMTSNNTDAATTNNRCSMDQRMRRFMEVSSMLVAVVGDGPRGGGELDFVRPARNDALAFLHALEHLHETGCANPQLHRPFVEGLAAFHDEDQVATVVIDERRLRHCHAADR